MKVSLSMLVGILSSTISALLATAAGELGSGSIQVADAGRGSMEAAVAGDGSMEGARARGAFFFAVARFGGAGTEGSRGCLLCLPPGAAGAQGTAEDAPGTAVDAAAAGLGGGTNPRHRWALGLAATAAGRGGGSSAA